MTLECLYTNRWLFNARRRRSCLFFCLLLLLQSSGRDILWCATLDTRLILLSSFSFMFHLPLVWVCNTVSLIKVITHRVKTRDSSVGIVTRLAGIGPGFDSKQENIETVSGAAAASYLMASGLCFPGVKRPGCEADRSPPFSAWVKMSGAVPLPPLCDLMPWTETTLLLHWAWRIVSLWCDAVWSGRNLPTFWKSLLLPFSR